MNRRPSRLPIGVAIGVADKGRRLIVPLAAGALVTLGTLLLVSPGGSGADTAEPATELFPTVVAVEPIAAGTPLAGLAERLEVRMLPADARATGTFASLDEIEALAESDGAIVVDDLAIGEHLLRTDVASDPVAAVAEGYGRDYVAVSVRVDPQRWVGPFSTTGAEVDVYATATDGTASRLIVSAARIIAAPDTAELDPRSESVITLAVPADSVTAVIDAAAAGTLWMVGS